MLEPSPSDIFEAGQVLNNTYEIEGVLGRGGTGVVYRAFNQVTGRVFAIKALNAQFSYNADYIELMKREEEMRNVLHDAVVRYNECSRTDDGHVILVMDYVPGPSLADAMKQHLSPKEILIIGHRIAQGLVAAHDHGIVHRDLSPDNIILRDSRPEEAVLIDFGIAKDTAGGARTIVGNQFAGKYDYASPEQLEGRTDARSDFYALGATLLAAHNGETPYLGSTPGEIVRRKQHALETEGVPEPLGKFIRWLTATDPAERPTEASEIVVEIERLLGMREGGRTRGRDTRMPLQSVRRGGRRATDRDDSGMRRSRVSILVGVLVLLGACIGAIFIFEDTLFPDPLPVFAPYVLRASVPANGTPELFANAPDAPRAESIASAFRSATGAGEDATEIQLGDGVPDDGWVRDIADLIGLLTALEYWELDVADRTATLRGLAADSDVLSGVEVSLGEWREDASLQLTLSVLAGPENLSADSVEQALAPFADCGPLQVEGDDFPLGGRVTVRGQIANLDSVADIESTLAPRIGSRDLDVRLSEAGENICAIRQILPPAPESAISTWLAEGEDRELNLTGIFTTGQNPIAELHIPATITDAYLWVMIVDTEGSVIHAIPDPDSLEQSLGRLGRLEGDIRVVPILHPISALQDNPRNLALRVDDENFGVSEIVAIVSSTPLLELRRPRQESIIAASEALQESLAGRENDIVGIAFRRIETRPGTSP